MTLLVELLGNVMISGGLVLSSLAIKRKIQPKVDCFGALPWSIYSRGEGFRCPKCINIGKNKTQYPICSCESYHAEHFHFKCNDCGYTNILRTADDK